MIRQRTLDVGGLRIAYGSADDGPPPVPCFGGSTNISTMRVEAPAMRGTRAHLVPGASQQSASTAGR